MNSLDLFLHYKFTDRGGKQVFDIHPASDRLMLKNCLGEIRLDPRGSKDRKALDKEAPLEGMLRDDYPGPHGDGTG